MATIIRGLLAPFLKSNELIAKVDEGHSVTFATKFELEKAPIKRQRLLDIADLQRYVVQTDGARFFLGSVYSKGSALTWR